MGKQTFAGLVISQGKMDKTVKVRVQRIKFNRLVQKDIVNYKDYLVHDEANKCKEGDVVRIEYFRKFSTRKAFAVTEIMRNKGTEWMRYQQEAPKQVAQEERQRKLGYAKEREERLKGVDPAVEDLRTIEKAVFTDTDNTEKIKELKEKYNLTSWPPTHEVVGLDFQSLKNSLDEVDLEIKKSDYKDYVKHLMTSEPDKTKQILKAMGREDVTKPHIMKNLLMTHFARNFENA